MKEFKLFLRKKDIVVSGKRYGIDALGAMAQGLFCTLLVGTILNTVGQQFNIGFLNEIIVSVGSGEGAMHYTIGGLASAMVGPGIAVAIGFALHCPTMVLFSLIPVGFAANAMAGAGGPLAVYFVTIVAAELGKLVSKETKIDILVTPSVTVLAGIMFAKLVAAPIGSAAQAVGYAVMKATELQPFFMGIVVSVARDNSMLVADFDGKRVALGKSDLIDFQQAYAISIHKSQGSEFPIVVIPLLRQHFVMLQRNLLYTAITRGRKKVFVVGNLRAWYGAVKNARSASRKTFLKNRLEKL